MLSTLRIGAFAAVLGSVATGSAAVAGGFSIDPYGALLAEAAALDDGSYGNSGIVLPEAGEATFSVGFVIPRNYQANRPVRIRLSWHTPGTNCAISLRPNFVDRTRANHPAPTGDAAGGLVPGNGSTALPTSNLANVGHLKTYILTADQGFTEQLPSDAIVIGFYRLPTDSEDTCSDDLIVSGIEVLY